MRTVDFREFLASRLKTPEERRNFVLAFYEEDGIKGVHDALDEIARADELNGIQTERLPINSKELSEFEALQKEMSRLGLEFRLTRTSEQGKE